jgi:hypothetical protein
VPLGTRQVSTKLTDEEKTNMGKISSTGEASATAEAGSWEQVEVGMHDAICIDWYHIPEYNAGDFGVQERIAIDFMVGQKTADGEPMTIRKTYNNTTSSSGNLYKALKSWRDEKPVDFSDFHFDKLIGVKATIMIDDFTPENGGGKRSYISKIKPPKKSNDLIIDASLKRKLMTKIDGEWQLVPAEEVSTPTPAPAPKKTQPPAPAPAPQVVEEEDDDVPF